MAELPSYSLMLHVLQRAAGGGNGGGNSLVLLSCHTWHSLAGGFSTGSCLLFHQDVRSLLIRMFFFFYEMKADGGRPLFLSYAMLTDC